MSDHLEARSEYLQYLPQVFRSSGGEDAGPDSFLPNLLLAFQKILTGVRGENGAEDPHEIPVTERLAGKRDGQIYLPLETTIDQLDRFFDPFRTDPRFLDWLASWVALELKADWNTAEKRKMIARMVSAVKRVGLKSGLYDFLDIYASERVRPRVVIDDDEALFRLVLQADGSASLNVLAHASLDVCGGRHFPFLYRPIAIAVKAHTDPAQVRYLVADAGRPGGAESIYPPMIQPSLWLLKPNGELDDLHWTNRKSMVASTDSPLPLPINIEVDELKTTEAKLLSKPVAVAFDPLKPDDFLVLEQGKSYSGGFERQPGILRYSSTGFKEVLLNLKTAIPAGDVTTPVDMVVDAKRNRLVVLDAMDGNVCCLRIVPLAENTPKLTTIKLSGIVKDPTAIAQEDENTFVITDAHDESQEPPEPGTLYRVTIALNDADQTWQAVCTDLLEEASLTNVRWHGAKFVEGSGPKYNPLVYPTGLVVVKPGEFLVCDTGVKTNSQLHNAFRAMAEPAAVFHVVVDVDPDSAARTFTINRLTPRGMLSWPSRIAQDETGNAFLVTDTGEEEISSSSSKNEGDVATDLHWRGQANRLAVSVLYSIPRLDKSILGDDSDAKQKAIDHLNRANAGIQTVVDQMKPLHATQVLNPFR